MPATNVKSKWSGGDLKFYDKSGNIIFSIDGTNRQLDIPDGSTINGEATGAFTFAAGEIDSADIANGAIDASHLNTNLKRGFVNLPLVSWREIASNDIPATASVCGLLGSDTTPVLGRVNTSTDPQLRITWVAGNTDAISQQFAYPPDLDDTADVTVHMMIAKGSNTNTTAVVAVGYYEGVGDTNAGGNSAALATSDLAEKSVTIASADIAAHPGFATLVITPGAHANDAEYVYATWVEYQRKS